jgi:hypothetical protein
MKLLTFTLISLIAGKSFATDFKSIRTEVTCVSNEPGRGSAAIYKDPNGNMIGITVEPGFDESVLLHAFHDSVTWINQRKGERHSGVFISKKGIFQMNMLRDGACYAIVQGIGTSTPEFAILGKAHYHSKITVVDERE